MESDRIKDCVRLLFVKYSLIAGYACTKVTNATGIAFATGILSEFIIIIIIMNYISTRYNFTYTKINYVQDIKRKKVIFQPAVLTQAEIRNNYKKIILGRWKQWQDYLMLICMLQVRLKISNSC